MKDTQLRGLVLQRYYENRRGGMYLPQPSDFEVPITEDDILAISDQLGQHGLIEWKSLKSYGAVNDGIGKISAFGIDVVEGEATSDIKVEFVQNNTVNVSGSTNVIVGDNNRQRVTQSVEELVQLIDNANATQEQKQEAMGLLRRFLVHPLVVAIAGGAVGLPGGK